MARSFSGDVRACILLVLLSRSRLTAGTAIHGSRTSAAGARGTFRWLGGGGGFPHPGLRRLRFGRRGCRGRRRRGGCGGGHLLAGALPRAVLSSPHRALGRYQGTALPYPFQALDGAYGLQPLGVPREVP